MRCRVPFYVPHLIFSLHVHSFWFLVMSLTRLINLPLPPGVDIGSPILLTVNPLYLLLAQRRVYGGGWLRNILQTLALLTAQLVVLVLVVAGMLAVAVASS